MTDLNMRNFVPPVQVQNSLKTLNVEILKRFDLTVVGFPPLKSMKQLVDTQMTVYTAISVCMKRLWFVLTPWLLAYEYIILANRPKIKHISVVLPTA